MTMSSQAPSLTDRYNNNNPFANPESWNDNNPFKASITSASPRSSISSVSKPAAHSSHQPSRSATVRQNRGERPFPATRTYSYDPPRAPKSENAAPRRKHKPTRSYIPGPDTIDRMGDVLGTGYHHDGPFEATLAARQIPGYSPVEALRESNAAAIAATPRANIIDSLEKHYPMQGTAVIPSGMNGMAEYEEYDIQVQEGNYARYPGVPYHPNDRKGKGEPSYSIEEAEKAAKAARRGYNTREMNEYEMQAMKNGSLLGVAPVNSRRRSNSGSALGAGNTSGYYHDPSGGLGSNVSYEFKEEGGLGRSASSAGRMEGLKKRLNSLRRKNR